MDHVPMPAEPYNPIVIPYYDTDKKFDGGDLVTFPGRSGKKIADFLSNQELFLDRRSLKEVNDFLVEVNSNVSDGWKSEHGNVLGRLVSAITIIVTALFSDRHKESESIKEISTQISATSLDEKSNKQLVHKTQDEPDPTQSRDSYSRSYFWTDCNLAQALAYLRGHVQQHMDPEEGPSVAYCWQLLFQTLAFLVPKGSDDGEEDVDDGEGDKRKTENLKAETKDVFGGSVNANNDVDVGTLEELDVLNPTFCKQLVDSLHELFPDEVPDFRNQFEETDSDANMGFLQQWLFFGTLQKIFELIEVPIDLSKYIAIEKEVPVLSTKQLNEDLQLWEAMELSRSDGKADRRRQPTEVLVDVVMFAVQLSDRTNSEKISDFLTVVHVLCVSIEAKASRIYESETGALGTRNKWLGHKLVQAGWCARQAEIILDSYVLVMVYYIYLLGPPKRPHDGANCSKWTCHLDNIQEYQTLHHGICKDGDFCKLLKSQYSDGPNGDGLPYTTDLEKLSSIVESKEIPLISMGHPVFDSMVSLDLELEKYDVQSDVRYVAISHVWADGIGNPESNSLPLCQISDLRNMVRNIFGDDQTTRYHLWIDTLCVPVNHPSRKDAILNMRSVYESATVVLVLDSELRSHELPSDPTETLARIVNSRWARRLWTFQEAALAQNLFFQFRDNCVSMHSLYEALKPKPDILFNAWSLFEIGWFPSLRDNRNNSQILRQVLEDPDIAADIPEEDKAKYRLALSQLEENNSAFSVIWRAVRMRTTQKPEDEVICVATLLNLDLEDILSTSIRDRSKRLLLLQEKVPSSIIFSRMRRMLDDGFRWAPKSFMSKAFLWNSQSKKGVVSEEGLLVSFPGILFRGNKVSVVPEVNDYQFILDETSGEQTRKVPYSVHIDTEGLKQYEGEIPVRDWGRFDPSTYAIILPQPLMALEGDGKEGTHRMYGVLVSICVGKESEMIRVLYIEQIMVTRGLIMIEREVPKEPDHVMEEVGENQTSQHTEETTNAPKPLMKKRTSWERTFGAVAGNKSLAKTSLANPTLLPETQKWCIG